MAAQIFLADDQPVNDQLVLRAVQLAKAAEVYPLMAACYPPVYAHLWEDGGQWYLEHVFSETAVLRDLAEADAPYWFVEWQGQRVGILRLCLHQPSPEFPDGNALKLHRIYLHPAAHGLGVGQALMEYTLAQARLLHKAAIWLEAMDTQTAALGFYEKQGYTTYATFRLTFERMHPHLRGMVRMQRPVEQV
jgi:diamine N-acetyltransferase